jgi:DUF4097 and DUF4098 domain-containing protein YvlB
MKTNAIIRIIIYSLILAILLCILLSATAIDQYFTSTVTRNEVPTPTESVRQINQHEITTPIQNIEIEWVAGSITIHRSSSLNHISIDEFTSAGSEYEMIMKQSGQTLKIQFCEESIKFPSFGINTNISKDLVITVPESWNCNNLEIDAAATEVEIHDLTIRELDFDGASGELILNNCSIENLDIDTASGDVSFSGSLEELDFDAASASFRGEFNHLPRHLDLDAMSGDLELVLPPDAGFICNLDTMSGSFDSDFSFKTHDKTYVCGDGECKINVNSMSGNVSILKGIA